MRYEITDKKSFFGKNKFRGIKRSTSDLTQDWRQLLLVKNKFNLSIMKTMTQFLSGAFMLGCAQFSLAGPDCAPGTCSDTTVAVAGAKTECAEGGHCDKSATVAAGHERVQYVVKGLTCNGCSTEVKASLVKLEGATVQKVCHKSGTAVVDFDTTKLKKADVAAVLNQGDYSIAAERMTVSVEGMTCTSCTGKVTKALNAVDGVTVQTVCHKSGKAVVDVVDAKTNRAAVVKVITDKDYKAS